MKKDEYIAEAVSKITNRKAKRETEKELAAHIDELVEFYLDRSGSKEEAEEKAVADMGTPESVSSSFGKLHSGAGKAVFLVIIGVILTSWLLEITGIAEILVMNDGLIFLHDDIYKVWGVHTAGILSSVNLNLLYLTLLLLTVFGFTKKKILLVVSSGAELYLLLSGLLWFVFGLPSFAMLPGALIPAVLYALTIILIRITDKEEKRLDENKETFGLAFRICTSWGVSVLLVFYCLVASSLITVALDYTLAHREPLTVQNSMGDLPTEVCDEQIASTVNISDYYDPYDMNNYWNFDEEYLHPRYMLPERFNTETQAYWLPSEGTDFIYHLTVDNDDYTAWGEWLLRKGYSFPSLTDSELSKITAADIDITDLIVGEDAQKARKVLIGIYNGEDYIIHDYKYARNVCWYFVGGEGLYLRRGAIVATKSGECYITSDVSYIHDKDGEEVIASNGPMFKLSDEASKQLVNRLEHIG